MNNIEESKQRLAKNWAVVCASLKALGVAKVVVEYRGSGDSGEGLEIQTTPDGVPLTALVSQFEERSTFANGAWTYKEQVADMSLERAIEEITDHVIRLSGNSGYEINEGGGGTLSMDVAAQRFDLDHFDYVVEEEHNYWTNEEILGEAGEADASDSTVETAGA